MKIIPKLPATGDFVRGVGSLVRIEIVPPPPAPPPKTHYIFEEINARTEMRHAGDKIKDIETLTDFYGLGTSVKSAIKDAKKLAEAKKLGPKSDLEIVVVKITSQRRKILDVQKEANFYDQEFRAFTDLPDRWCSTRDLPDEVEEDVWSSKSAT